MASIFDETIAEKNLPDDKRGPIKRVRLANARRDIEEKAKDYVENGKGPLTLAEITTWIALHAETR